MKYVFVPAKVKERYELPEKSLAQLDEEKAQLRESHNKQLRIALSGAIQFVDSLPGIKAQLEERKICADIIKGSHSVEPGQIVGCDYFDIDDSPYDILLYVGDGVFHPKAMMLANHKKIYAYNPLVQTFTVLDRSHMDKMRKRHNGAIASFLSKKNIGVLVTIKPGQNRYVFVPKLKKKFPDKNYYVIAFDTVDFASLDDFNFVDVWVNTTCPRVAFDDTNKISKPVCNVNDLLELNTDT